jgi:glycosyltransferase involved in cell wall biosynthesis
VVHIVVPAGIDDPARPSGGNRYDRRLIETLPAAGLPVREYVVADAEEMARAVAEVPDGAVLFVDGLLAADAAELLVPASRRARLVVLVHMIFGDQPAAEAVRERESAVLAAAAAVIIASRWGRDRLLSGYNLAPDRVHVATPGVDPAPIATGTPGGGALLCVAALAEHKGQDVLLATLASVPQLPWRCVLAGSPDREPAFVERLRRTAEVAGIADRVRFAGALSGAALDQAYAAADLLVLPSYGEMYGMVVAEALARGVPVLASDVGGVREPLGSAADGDVPGVLVPPGDPGALADAIADWLGSRQHRDALRRAAAGRRETLPTWESTAEAVAGVLREVAERPVRV